MALSPKKLRLCTGAACAVKGSIDAFERLHQAAEKEGHVKVERSSCLGACSQGPVAEWNHTLKAPYTLEGLAQKCHLDLHQGGKEN